MIEILHSSIAVTAAAHNPSLLHPSFLTHQEIVPADWALEEGPICTPALSLVKFANGVVISVELQKLQVLENNPPADASQSVVPRITEKYTRTLPHVTYTGVGINVGGLVPSERADETTRAFLAERNWSSSDLELESVGIRLLYRALGARLRLAFDSGSVKRAADQSEPRRGIVIAANYHFDISEGDRAGQVADVVGRFAECVHHFRQNVPALLTTRTEHATR